MNMLDTLNQCREGLGALLRKVRRSAQLGNRGVNCAAEWACSQLEVSRLNGFAKGLLPLSMGLALATGFTACSGESEPVEFEPKVDEPIEENAWTDHRQPFVFTVQEILDGKEPVRHVVHDPGKTGWQFLDGKDLGIREPVVIKKWDMLQTDETLGAIIDLPVGWMATREDRDSPWVRSENPLAEKPEGDKDSK